MNDNDEMDVVTIQVREPDDEKEYEKKLSIKLGASIIIGTRDYQQDAIYTGESQGMTIGIVCDGMGGMTSGDVASKTAIGILSEDFLKLPHDADIPDFFRREAGKMDDAVSGIAAGEALGSGTTVVSVIVRDGLFYWLSVGDSRIYVIRNNQIRNLNRDHNLKLRLDEMLQKGQISMEEYERKSVKKEALISYLGIGNVSLVDVSPKGIRLEENDILLLSSDGLYKRLTNDEVLEVVMCEEPDMKRAAKRLTDVVNLRTKKSQDNTSVIIMQYNRY